MKWIKLLIVNFSLLIVNFAYADVDKALVGRAEKYLNGITGLSGTFVQTNNGKKQDGNFDMMRPGRVRLDYKNMPVQLISDGKDLYFFDSSLDQITTVPLESTPAGILIRDNIKLTGSDIVVTDTTTDTNTFSIKMHMRESPGAGNMVVTFDKSPVKLNSWTVVDASGAKTDVVFSGLKVKTDFGKNHFQISRHKTVSASAGDGYYE